MMGLGWIPDPVDARDAEFALSLDHLFGAPGEHGSCEELFSRSPANQNGQQSCVVQVIAQTVRAAHVKAGKDRPPTLSRHGVWWPCRKLARRQQDNVGTHIRTGFKVLNAVGFCAEKYWPHSLGMGEDAAFRTQPPAAAQRMMADQRKGKQKTVYRRIFEVGTDRIDRLKRAVDAGFPPIFGTDVGKDLVHGDIDPFVPIGPPSASDVAGGHAMIVGAYHGDDFKIRTSWGDVLDNGWFWMSAAYVARWRDIWVVEAAPWYTELA
jgi:hypothetical protein